MDQRILSALLSPDAYPEPTQRVELRQTHVSYLFMTDRFVYKVKKSVDFGFLDFTDLERRGFFCAEEVRLNSRLCKDMYLGVVTIRSTDQGYRVCTEGTVVEYAVKMKRLPADRMLNLLLDRGEVSEGEIREIAALIARFHLTAETGEGVSGYGLPEAIRRNWEENISQVEPFVPAMLPESEFAHLKAWGDAFIRDRQDLLRQRVSKGFIREGDGDIHSENICLSDSIRIFDCIEFSARFRCADTMADLAFLLMDLDFHHRPDLSRIAIDAYTAITADSEGRALLPFYKAYRAIVRGKVESLRSRDGECPPDDRVRSAEKAAAYFRLARGLTLRDRVPPTLFLMCGLTGSGKTSLARALSFELGIPVVRSDTIRKELCGLHPLTRVEPPFASGIYNEDTTRRTYDAMAQMARRVLAGGTGVIVDASFIEQGDRADFTRLAESLHVPHRLLCLRGDDTLLEERLLMRAMTGNDASDGRPEILAGQRSRFTPPADEGSVIGLEASRPPETLVADIYRAMGLRR